MAVERHALHIGDVNRLFIDAERPSSDDVSVTLDGRRLDSKEKGLAFIAELERARAADAEAGARSA